MKAKLKISCDQCAKHLGVILYDTAGIPWGDELQKQLDKVILVHRKDCKYYGGKNEKVHL